MMSAKNPSTGLSDHNESPGPVEHRVGQVSRLGRVGTGRKGVIWNRLTASGAAHRRRYG